MEKREKNPAAVALGKLGGAKGGKARARALSAAERKRIASKAGKASAAARSKEEKQAIGERLTAARLAKRAKGIKRPSRASNRRKP